MNDHQAPNAFGADRIRLIAIETMKGAFGNEGALPPFARQQPAFPREKTLRNVIDFMFRSDYCSDIACVVKDKAVRNGKRRSPYWYASYVDANGRRVKRSTGLTSRSKALQMALALQKAADEARRGALTEARTRELLSEVLQSVNGEGLHVFTVEQWFGHFVNQKKKSRAAATGKRHAQTMREFIAFLAHRAKLNIAAITSRDIASFRDHRHSLGLAPATINIDVAILSAAFNAALRQGHVSVNPCRPCTRMAPASGSAPSATTREPKTTRQTKL